MNAYIEGLEAQLEAARKVLAFADGYVFANSLKHGEFDFVLADLYAEDCAWAQEALRAAGCHPRGRFLDKQGQEQ